MDKSVDTKLLIKTLKEQQIKQEKFFIEIFNYLEQFDQYILEQFNVKNWNELENMKAEELELTNNQRIEINQLLQV